MAIDFGYYLGRKYDIMSQNAAAETTRANAAATEANANANLTGVRAGLLPGQTSADVAEAKARTNQINVNAGLAPGLASASEAASYGSAAANRAQGGLYDTEATGNRQASDTFAHAVGGDQNAMRLLSMFFGRGLPTSASPSGVNGYGFTTP